MSTMMVPNRLVCTLLALILSASSFESIYILDGLPSTGSNPHPLPHNNLRRNVESKNSTAKTVSEAYSQHLPLLDVTDESVLIQTLATNLKEYLTLLAERIPKEFILLKWNSSGTLDKVSPGQFLAHKPWVSTLQELYGTTQPSDYGTVALLFNSDVLDIIMNHGEPPVPVLMYTLPHKYANRAEFVLLPNPYDINGYSASRVKKAKASLPSSDDELDKRQNAIVWRGKIRGSGSRLALMDKFLNENDSKWLDVADTEGNVPETALTIEEMVSLYKYQIDIGGVSGTAWDGLRWKMCASRSAVFKVDTFSKDWWHDSIKPWVHYIPVQKDLRDLRERYDWAERNPAKVKEIIQEGEKMCLATVEKVYAQEVLKKNIFTLQPASYEISQEADEIFEKDLDLFMIM